MKMVVQIALAVSLVTSIISCSPVAPSQEEPSPGVLADCFISFNLSAWNDLDGDGLWDAAEPPLAGVEFHLDGPFASLVSDYPGLTDEDGLCTISTWSPGECIAGDYTLTASPPGSYQPTTPASVTLSLTAAGFSGEAHFGYRAGIVSLMPGRAKINI